MIYQSLFKRVGVGVANVYLGTDIHMHHFYWSQDLGNLQEIFVQTDCWGLSD